MAIGDWSSDVCSSDLKVRPLSPCAVANGSLAFLWQFWSSGFFLAERPVRLCRYRTRFYCGYRYFCTCFLQHLHNVLCCCSWIDVHFSHQSMFTSRRQRRVLLPERYDGCVVPWCLYLHTIVFTDERGTFRRLEIAPKDEPDL